MLSLKSHGLAPEASKRAPDFAEGLPGESINELYLASISKTAAAREVIVCEGDASTFVFEVLKGVAKLYKLTPDGRRQVTGFVYPGQLFGLSLHGSYVYTAEAITPMSLCLYPRSKLDQLAARIPGLAQSLLALTTRELIAAQEQMLLLGRKTATEKIASFLVWHSEAEAVRGGDGRTLYLPMTRADIGDYLGLTTETVSRVLNALKNRGTISFQANRHVRIHEHAHLLELAIGSGEGFDY